MTASAGEAVVEVSGTMTLDNARAQLESGMERVRQGARVFDLAPLGDVDSSCLAVIFAWQREALRAGGTLRIEHPPASLLALAELYGVADLLPPAQ
jgi:phospholipid transport system transporter-binding protein